MKHIITPAEMFFLNTILSAMVATSLYFFIQKFIKHMQLQKYLWYSQYEQLITSIKNVKTAYDYKLAVDEYLQFTNYKPTDPDHKKCMQYAAKLLAKQKAKIKPALSPV